jgi:hypothetical protein
VKQSQPENKLEVPSQPRKEVFQDSFLERDEPSRDGPVLEARERLRSESEFDRASDMTPREEKITPPVRDSKGTEDSFMDRDDVNDDMPSIKVDNEDTMHPKKSDNK